MQFIFIVGLACFYIRVVILHHFKAGLPFLFVSIFITALELQINFFKLMLTVGTVPCFFITMLNTWVTWVAMSNSRYLSIENIRFLAFVNKKNRRFDFWSLIFHTFAN